MTSRLIGRPIRFLLSGYLRGFVSNVSFHPFRVTVIRNNGWDINFYTARSFNSLYEYHDGTKWTRFSEE